MALPLGDGPSALPGIDEDGTFVASPKDESAVEVAVRVLLADEEMDVLAAARARCVEVGHENGKAGDPIYDLALMEETILRACLDAEQTEKDVPFFANIGEVRSLDRDRIAFLYEAQARFSDECSPKLRTMSQEQMLASVAILARAEETEARRFFERLGPALQWTFTRISAPHLLISLTLKSPSSSSENSTGQS